MSNTTQSVTMTENQQSGGAVAEQALPHQPTKAKPPVRRHLPPTHKAYWEPRLGHPAYTRDGQRIEIPVYSIRLQHLGRRAEFNLGSSDKDSAATKARDIWVYLKANGWDATLAKYKPQPAATNKLTIGDYLAAVQETGKLRLHTFLNYQNCLHSILARVFGIKDTKAKYDYRTGGNQKWRERLNTIRLEKLTPTAVSTWMKKSVGAAGSSPVAITSAKRTANSYVRCARSLFSAQLLKESSIKRLTLPKPLPFEGVELFETGSTKYFSKINAQTLIDAARRDLKQRDPEAYKVFLLGLLGGMRKGEIDLSEWRMVDWQNHIIRLEETEWLHLKTADSAGEITIDPEVLSELRTFMAERESPFIINSTVSFKRGQRTVTRVRPPRPDAKRRYYRCEPTFKRLYEWLRSKGVPGNKPLHELRKEIGALIATEHGIFAASKYLRHADITTTSRHYADHKARITVGLGKYLQTSPRICQR